MMRQNVLNHAQDVERRVGEIFKPMLAPVHCKKNNLKKILNNISFDNQSKIFLMYNIQHNIQGPTNSKEK